MAVSFFPQQVSQVSNSTKLDGFPSQGRHIRVLSIDGGGMRGVVPATILAELEAELINKSGDPNTRLVDYFDFFTGTSTGGILTCLYLLPDEQHPGRPRFSAKEVLELYQMEGPKIFYRSWKRRLTSMMGFTREKFDSRQMEKMLHRFMGEARLKDLVKPCRIPAYDISSQESFFFSSCEAQRSQAADYAVWQVAQSTASAPIYFEPTVALAADGSRRTLIDGGVFATNPSLSAYHYLQQHTQCTTTLWYPWVQAAWQRLIVQMTFGRKESYVVGSRCLTSSVPPKSIAQSSKYVKSWAVGRTSTSAGIPNLWESMRRWTMCPVSRYKALTSSRNST